MRKKKQQINDEPILIECMNRVILGNFSEVEVNTFGNPETGELFNAMLNAFKLSNNPYVMRMNDSMSYIANSENIMSMIEQLRVQNGQINEMHASSEELEQSIQNIATSIELIKEDTHTAVVSSAKSAEKLCESISVVKESTGNISQINDMILSFQEKTNKITEIVDIVKKIANKSGLLALNASIEAARAGEAGRGFAIVANQVKDLSNNTTDSAQDIVNYINELQQNITDLVQSVNLAASQLENGNKMVENSVDDINEVNSQIEHVTTKVDEISEAISVQNNVVNFFVKSLKQLSDSYELFSECCTETGEQMFKITRLSGKLRSDMARSGSNLYAQDWIKLFEIDHLIFTWRIYNYLAGYETLKINQVNTTHNCNLGKWIDAQTNPEITGCASFKKLSKAHEDLHTYAVASFNATSKGHREEAIAQFNKVRDAYAIVANQLHEVSAIKTRLGDTDYTKFVNTLD